MKQEYIANERKRIKNLFNRKKHTGFTDCKALGSWFEKTIRNQDYKCYYCSTSIFDIQKLIKTKVIKERKIRYGCRGKNFEIDKINNDKGYTQNNCVLCCYYCNNDKSNTIDGVIYKEYFGDKRKDSFLKLIKEKVNP